MKGIFSSIINCTPSILDSEKMSQELLTPVMTPPKKTLLFYFYIINPYFKNMGSGGFRVPGKLGQSGFRWVPGSRSEPKKWVPGGSGFQVGTPKSGFRASLAKLGSVTVLKK